MNGCHAYPLGLGTEICNADAAEHFGVSIRVMDQNDGGYLISCFSEQAMTRRNISSNLSREAVSPSFPRLRP